MERDRLLEQEHVARQETEDEQRRSTFLADASRLLASLDYATALAGVARLAVPFLADWCAVDITRTDGAGLERIGLAYTEEVGRALAGATEQLVPTPIEARDPHVWHAEDLRRIHQLGLRSYLATPLQVPGKTLGVLTMVSTRDARYGTKDIGLAANLAERLALSVENARLYEGAQQALRLREDFISVASHELNTPITSLLLGLQTLGTYGRNGGIAPEEADKVLVRAERQCLHLRALVNQLLDVSRIQAHKLSLDLSDIELGELVREVATRLQPDLERARCPITIDVPEPVRGRWDRLRLEQVIGNLLSNALKYGACKPIEVHVFQTGKAAFVRVRDLGIGIPLEQQKAIFDRFGRGVTSHHYSGLGLGLYIANEIVHALGGQIRVESRPGAGALFEVELPIGE
jgi:signal transduction histidine kinase